MKTLGTVWLMIFLGAAAYEAAGAEGEVIAASFRDGYLSWSNTNPELFYTVECKPSLGGTNDWDGAYRAPVDVKSSQGIITVPVGVFYRVVGTTNPAHTRTLSDATTAVAGGYYDATNLAAVDPDLAPGNIATNVTIFGVSGTLTTIPAPVAKTGQTASYYAGDDGTHQAGAPWPTPRFTVQANTNVVLDNVTSLMWMRDANLGGTMNWNNAVDFCNNLNAGEGTHGYTDWRLPNLRELHSLVNHGCWSPPLPGDHPFWNVQLSPPYWSSTTRARDAGYAWTVMMYDGTCYYGKNPSKVYSGGCWPVRGGR